MRKRVHARCIFYNFAMRAGVKFRHRTATPLLLWDITGNEALPFVLL